jgi:probable HAF family extracellular repeat protein
MKKRTMSLIIVAFTSFAILLITKSVAGQMSASSAAATPSYSLTDLGTLGGDNSIPFWLTNTGEVIGVSDTGQFDAFGNPVGHAFRWIGGRMQDLTTLGGTNSSATGGNNAGQAAGSSDLPGGATSHAFLWSGGTMADLGALNGPTGSSYAQLVNDKQQVAGGSTTLDGGFHTTLWNYGAIADLGTLPCPTNDCVSFGNGINDLGQVVGGSQVSDVPDPTLGFPPFHATLWSRGEVLDLGAGPNESIGSAAFNINNKTQVVGRTAAPDLVEGAVAHAFLWQSGVMRDLGVPAGLGDDNSEANSINDNGLIVGDSGVGFIETYAPDHAIIWQNGSWTDLNTRIPAGSGYYLIVAFDANARGQIIVCAVQLTTGNVHAALLTPQLANVSGNQNVRAVAAMQPPSLSPRAQHLLELVRRMKSGPRRGHNR